MTELLRSRILGDFTFTTIDDEANDQNQPEGESDEEAELVLFAGPSKTAESQKIRLSSPDAEPREPGLLVKKPRSYYFADEVTSETEEQLQAIAVTGAQVREMSQIPWPGCALPWKVLKLTHHGMKKAVLVGHPPALVELEDGQKKRSRKGKKSRIALRKKMQAADHKQAEQARIAQEKAEADREKRTRRNREKKVKKKAREKAKKETAADVDEPMEAPPEIAA